MKSFLFTSILIWAFCSVAFGQNSKTLPCPIIDVTGPAGITQPGEAATFTGNLSKEAEKFNLQYYWMASDGEIIEGQGTLTAKVLQKPENAGESLTLTLKIIGLPEGCANTDSESMSMCILYTLELVDEFSLIAIKIDKARLDNFAERLQENPPAQAYIIEKFKRRTSQIIVEQKNQKIFEYLKSKGIESDRIVLQNAFADENLTQLVLVPASASPPSCDDCITVK